ncbi:bifunctional aspartate kinase/homoserine dehydrogenase I [Winogradskyella maritima]|uniref:Bifunctional aspartate kinase/homoserine dehydrogenase I n=1 Tax=Winogradskyella maritima TaxID=1517766 RepID=A0ABV8ADQ4_9FLAO|nr:bifunctional aspartate kinase/homoserine dehydrogenase I [Winogradskyella maritima]
MKVLKFGGTSVGSSENIHKVVDIVAKRSKDSRILVVISAVGGVTDSLLIMANEAVSKNESYKTTFHTLKAKHLHIAEEVLNSAYLEAVIDTLTHELDQLKSLLDGLFLINELSPKTQDKLLSFGERLSTTIVIACLEQHGLKVQLKNSQELIVTDNNFTNARVNLDNTYKNIKDFIASDHHDVILFPGFISKSETGEITTLGRGGSDYTASLIASAIDAEDLEIWTDVSGMFTTNPKLVKQAIPIEKLSYQEAIELSHFGAKVLYPPTVMPVLLKDIPIWIKNTNQPEEQGTLITNINQLQVAKPVKGISNIDNIALMTLQGSGMVGIPGFSKRLFETLANEKINIILITQSSSEHSICFAIDESDAQKAKTSVDQTFQNEISLKQLEPLIVETELSVIAVVGDNMKNHQGISGKMFSTLGKNNVNIRAIAQGASERNISAVISKKDVKKALNSLHERFFEDNTKQVNLFITGVGNVGQRLLEQIKQQKKYVKAHHKVNLRVVGISNSRTMVLDADGISLKDWKSQLDSGENASLNGFLEHAKSMNLRNSVFVDITANSDVANSYDQYLKESISVVACNKIACSSNYDDYQNLKALSLKYSAPFLFETNVGAGLPVIDTLNHLMTSGDKVNKIQAVLSGSLNFVFNNFNRESTFHDVVKQAQDEGYTEPDPRIDLSGVDVARKILILARESGLSLELTDISMENFLTESAMNANSVDDFYETLKSDEEHYKNLYLSAEKNNCQLKFVAELDGDKAKVGLQEIPEGHPFYNLEGKDNIVMFFTERYPEQPLIIKGAGAGADVTASGLFADIMRLANN